MQFSCMTYESRFVYPLQELSKENARIDPVVLALADLIAEQPDRLLPHIHFEGDYCLACDWRRLDLKESAEVRSLVLCAWRSSGIFGFPLLKRQQALALADLNSEQPDRLLPHIQYEDNHCIACFWRHLGLKRSTEVISVHDMHTHGMWCVATLGC